MPFEILQEIDPLNTVIKVIASAVAAAMPSNT
mgnify:CR=1 FL=1